MTNERQPEALRLAKILEDHYFYSDTNEAAAELRRLHDANEVLRAELESVTEQRDQLLDAAKLCRPHMYDHASNTQDCAFDRLCAAIAKATGETK